MYIIELLFKIFNKEKNKHKPKEFNYEVTENLNISGEKCEHIFLPIDSTKKILACTKCGYILKVTNQQKKNFFIK